MQVAHRLASVLECDRVIVMDGGQAVEQGNPHDLLKDSSSMFYSMYHAGGGGGNVLGVIIDK